MQNLPHRTTFVSTLYDRVAVVGRDPELADYANPRGEIHRVLYSVMAQDETGRRWRHNYSSQRRDVVASLLHRIKAAHADGHLPTLSPSLWAETDPEYGSEAYVAAEPHIVAAEREEG